MVKFSAIFLALSFAATMFSYPGLIGNANAQSDQGSESACGPGFILQQGKCIGADPVPTCPEGKLVETKDGLKCAVVVGDVIKVCPKGSEPFQGLCIVRGPPPTQTCQVVAGVQGTLEGGKCTAILLKNKDESACAAIPGSSQQPVINPDGSINKFHFKCIYPPTNTCPKEFPHFSKDIGVCFKVVDKVKACADPKAIPLGDKCVIFKDPILKCEQPGTSIVDGKCVKKPGSNQGTLIPPPTGP